MIDDPQSKRPYAIETTEVFRSAEIWVRRHTLIPGEMFPWHYHPTTYDDFIVLAGHLKMGLRKPTATIELHVGDYYRVEFGRIHRGANAGVDRCIYLNVQGPGSPQFVQVEEELA